MKKLNLRNQLIILFCFSCIGVKAQLTISDFENILLKKNSFYNGSDNAGGFTSGKAFFNNVFTSSQFGDYWSEGFAVSNMKDTLNGDYTNLYSAVTGGGYNKSYNYAVGTGGAYIKLNGIQNLTYLDGFYVTNSFYAYTVMKEGNMFSKKFGGATGNDPDWFKLSVAGFLNGNAKEDTVEFYLADFRFSDNSKDYILKTWEFVNLSALSKVDSIKIWLSSSDAGDFGINTPNYFCIDNVQVSELVGIAEETAQTNIRIFPNPAGSNVMITHPFQDETSLEIKSVDGKEVLKENRLNSSHELNLENLPPGMYFLTLQSKGNAVQRKIIKH